MPAIKAPIIPTVYEPTASGLPELRPYLARLWERRAFMLHLARTDLKSKHYETALGQVWIVLDPLLMAAVYFLLRSVLRSGGTPAQRNEILSHLLWGIFFFYYTSNSLIGGARSLVSGRGLILNASFPRAALPLTEILKSVFDFVPTLAVYFVLHILLGRPIATALLALPLVLLLQTTLNIGLALLFAPLMVFFRDTRALLPYCTRVWLYTTPALYALSEIPKSVQPYLRWNPLYPFYGAYEAIFRGHLPSAAFLFAAAAWAITFFTVGAIAFLAKERDFAVRL